MTKIRLPSAILLSSVLFLHSFSATSAEYFRLDLPAGTQMLVPGAGTSNGPVEIRATAPGPLRAPAEIAIETQVLGGEGGYSVATDDAAIYHSWSDQDAGKGLLRGTLFSDTDVVVTAADSAGETSEPLVLDIDVNAPLDAYVPPEHLAAVRVGDEIAIVPAVDGDIGTITWTYESGPASLHWDDALGALVGTASAPGVLSGMVLMAKDASDGAEDETEPFSIAVESSPLGIVMDAATIRLPATASMPVAVEGGHGTRTASVDDLPAGLVFDGSTISGAPVDTGVQQLIDISATASDDSGTTPATKTVVLTVNPELRAEMPSVSIETSEIGTWQATAVGLVGNPTWSLAPDSNELPGSLTLDPSGALTGSVEEEGIYEGIVLHVVDDLDQANDETDAFSIVVATDTTPNDFVIPALTAQEPDAVLIAGPFTPTGFKGTITISASDGTEIKVEDEEYAASATISLGQSFLVRTSAPSVFSTTAEATVVVGSGSPIAWSITTREQDHDADQFSIAAIADAQPGTTIESAAVEPTGFEGSIPITASNGGTVSVDGGPWSSSSTIAIGQAFRVSVVASSTFLGTSSTTVQLGGRSANFVVSTRAIDALPDVFSFEAIVDAEPNEVLTSDASTLTGFDGALTASANNGALLSVENGPFQAAVSISDGQSLRVRMEASSNWSTDVSTIVSVGQRTATWTATTRSQSVNANAFTIPAPASPVNPGVVTSSTTVTPSGFEGTISIAVAGGEISIAGNPFVAGTTSISATQSFVVRTTSSSSFGGTSVATVTLGGRSSSFRVTTRAQDTSALAFAITAPASPANPSATVNSAAVTPSGFEASIPFTVTGGTISVAGRTHASSGTIAIGESFVARVVANATYGLTAQATVSLGGQSASFVVTTRARDTSANAFSISYATAAVNPGTAVVSNAVATGGYEGAIPISVSGGTISIAGGGAVTSGNISATQTFTVRVVASAGYSTPATATVTLGGQQASMTITTVAQDTTPNAFAFTAVSKVTAGSTQTSNTVTIAGITGSVPISISGGTYSIAGAAYRSTAATVTNNQTVTVRGVASSTGGGTTTVTLTVGTLARSYVITTANSISSVSVLLVGGGGGGGKPTSGNNGGGGGGGGGLLTASGLTATGSYTITVGNGGAVNSAGGTSSALGRSAAGGSAGLSGSGANAGGASGSPTSKAGGSSYSAMISVPGGGGGGASGVGTSASQNAGGNGGAGLANSFTGTNVTYAGGGGGASILTGATTFGSQGGSGGGGRGYAYTSISSYACAPGNANTGGGGGGGFRGPANSACAGGSGVVVIKYSGSSAKATGGTISVSGGVVYHRFTSSGTFTVN